MWLGPRQQPGQAQASPAGETSTLYGHGIKPPVMTHPSYPGKTWAENADFMRKNVLIQRQGRPRIPKRDEVDEEMLGWLEGRETKELQRQAEEVTGPEMTPVEMEEYLKSLLGALGG